jgi:hypothetical protein
VCNEYEKLLTPVYQTAERMRTTLFPGIYILLSITNKMQHSTIFFITVNELCFWWFLHPSSGAQKLAVAASRLGIYLMLCVQFLSS